MKKTLKWVGIVLGSLLIIAVVGYNIMLSQTKKHSPADTAVYNQGDLKIEVNYCRPFKKDRKIFGELVPYGEVWRTGANEATTFKTSKDIIFGGQKVKAGEYTLWTLPRENEWEVIINDHEYGWGVNFDEKAQHDPQFDVARVTVPAQPMGEVTEQFTIAFDEDMDLQLFWDQTMIEVPIETK
ncbi:MAG: DUF2911 domain-containing protein [Luteibaculum sp.]